MFAKTWRWPVSECRQTSKSAKSAKASGTARNVRVRNFRRESIVARPRQPAPARPRRRVCPGSQSRPPMGLDVFELESSGDKITRPRLDGRGHRLGPELVLEALLQRPRLWSGNQLNLPAPLPTLRRKSASYALSLRQYFNYLHLRLHDGLVGLVPWEREIDWMAISGVNMPMSPSVRNRCGRPSTARWDFTDDDIEWLLRRPGVRAVGLDGQYSTPGAARCRRASSPAARVAETHSRPQAQNWAWNRCYRPLLGTFRPRSKKAFREAKIKQLDRWPAFRALTSLTPRTRCSSRSARRIWKSRLGSSERPSLFVRHVRRMRPPTQRSGLSGPLRPGRLSGDDRRRSARPLGDEGWLFFFDRGFWQPPQVEGLLSACPMTA